MKYKNNPLNIRYNPVNNWQGQIEPKRGFCQFCDLFHGFRAAVRLIIRYRSYGVITISRIISRWAPRSENDTVEYIRRVCSQMKVESDTKIVSQDAIYNLLKAMTIVEIGYWNDIFEFPLVDAIQRNWPYS